jgi:large subunit ribosomal protein L25
MAKLKATKRTEFGKGANKVLRTDGLTPAIIYGHGQDNVAVALNEHDLDVALNHGERILEIDLGDTEENVLIKEVQFDHFGQNILHVDLTRVDLTEQIEITVPLTLRGRAAGVDEGGVMQTQATELTVGCVVTAIPEEIVIWVNDLAVGDSIHAEDVELPEGVELVSDPKQMVCSVTIIEEEAPAEEEGEEGESLEPEVLTERKSDEDEEADES